MDPTIGRTNPTNARDGSSPNRYLYHSRGSLDGACDSSKNGNTTRYPEQVIMTSARAVLPSVKRTSSRSQDATSRLATTFPDCTRDSTAKLLLKNDRW